MRTTAKIAVPVAVLGITGASLAVSAAPSHAQPTPAHVIVYTTPGGKCLKVYCHTVAGPGTTTGFAGSGVRVAFVQGQWVAQAA
jgi:hypothetical protein